MIFRRIWNNNSFRMIRSAIKNINNDDFFSKKNVFQIHSYGKQNIGTAIYRIYLGKGGAGFFALMRFVLDGLYIADISGFIPYIQISDTQYNDKTDPDDNMFEYFYIQPEGLTSQIVSDSCFVVDYDLDHRMWLEDKYMKDGSLLSGYDFDYGLIDELALVKAKYMRLNETTDQRLSLEISELVGSYRTIGVHFRGNAFKVGFEGHPKGLDVQDYYQYIDEVLESGFERIFVATDDSNALDSLKSKYGDRVVFYSDTTRSNDGIDVHNHGDPVGKTGRDLGYEVLRDMMTLSKCDAFICGKSQVSFAVLVEKKMREEEFEYLRIIDLGVNSSDSKAVKKYNKKISEYGQQ